MAFPTALCASWRCALRRGASFGRQRGVLLGAQLALSQRQREWAEKAMEGRVQSTHETYGNHGDSYDFYGEFMMFMGLYWDFPRYFNDD